MKKIALVLVGILMLPGIAYSITYRVQHQFSGAPGDGANPLATPVLSENVLYGTTQKGGSANLGTIWKMEQNGEEYHVIKNFTDGPTDGNGPNASLLVSEGVIYGMTEFGGTSNAGIIYKINEDGSGFTVLHNFSFSFSDGRSPEGQLITDDDVLYGVTRQGGSNDKGIIFSINKSGSNFTILHSFTGSSTDGSTPVVGLVMDENVLFGMTLSGGSSNLGVIYKINTNGTNFSLLHSFQGGSTDGSQPDHTGLVIQEREGEGEDNDILYGMTTSGGENNQGTIFRINAGGSSYSIIYSFTGGDDGAAKPQSTLLIKPENWLVGTTTLGGEDNDGTVFRIRTNGDNFRVLKSFEGSDGATPKYGQLASRENNYFGTTLNGGSQGDGVSYDLTITEGDGKISVENNPAATGNLSIIDAYPNPASDRINLDVYSVSPFTGNIRIFDVTGTQVNDPSLSSCSIGQGEQTISLDTRSLTTGIYTLVIESGYGDLVRQPLVICR